MSSGGGGGQSGVTRYDWNPTMEGYWGGALDWASREAQVPYSQYQGQRVAGQNNDIWTALQRIRDMGNSGGPADTVAARQSAGNIASGGALDANPYMGDSPYFQAVLDKGTKDITDAYTRGTSADTTRLFNLSGAFGGSAHQAAIANNEKQLGDTLSNYVSGMRNQQYDRSGNLYESALGRQMQAIPLAFQGQQLSNDLNDRTLRAGDYQRNYDQQNLDNQYNQWTEQSNYGRNLLDWYANLLGRAQGSTGVTSSQSPYGGNNWLSQGIGAGLLGRSFGLF